MLVALQNAQQQMQAFSIQKQAMTLQKIEVEKAVEELERTDAKEEVYKLSGPIMIRSTKQRMLEELRERIERLETSIKRLEEHEKRTAEMAQENQAKLEKMLTEGSKKSAAG